MYSIHMNAYIGSTPQIGFDGRQISSSFIFQGDQIHYLYDPLHILAKKVFGLVWTQKSPEVPS